ncbi:MAG: hypothetical protein LBQ13_04675 [Endomicrobium sp.]|jgi:hypothetical protein|nr:hypothetical protein [Endomicrobium sp.]
MGKKISKATSIIPEEAIKAEIRELPKGDIIKISNKLNKEVFDNEAWAMPIDAFRIIFKAISDVRNKQFQKEDSQLALDFEETFKNDNSTFARFFFSVRDIIKNQRHERIEKALAYLEDYKKGWYELTNSKGEKVKTYVGLISNPQYTEKGKITFLINHYWIKQMLHIQPYNEATYTVIDRFSNNKHILFYLWLLRIDPATGTKVSINTLNQKFGLNYHSKSEMIRSFLMPIKNKLDAYSNVSFNVDKKNDDDNIYISVYNLVPAVNLPEPTKDKLYKKQKRIYIINRHNLAGEYKKRVETAIKYDNSFIVIQAYHQLMKNYRYTKKMKIENIELKELFELWQMEIIRLYNLTEKAKKYPEQYPVI